MKIHTQNIHELNLKSIINFLKLMGKVLCTAADMTTDMIQMRLTTWPLLHIHADLTKDIDNNPNKFTSRNQ